VDAAVLWYRLGEATDSSVRRDSFGGA